MNEFEKVDPLRSMEIELKQLNGFYNDIKRLDSQVKERDYEKDLEDLRDQTDLLRSEYSVLYAKLLDKTGADE